MLSIKPVKSAAGAAKYYNAEDNYYLSDKESLDQASGWYGKGALTLGYSGLIEREAFISLLNGKLPSGQQLGIKNEKGEIVHRPATDITFSAPKSISLLALVGGDSRLIKAHEQAVAKTLDLIEDQIAEARITQKGEIHFEKTKNLVIAQFQHTSSRELDPQLHNHCLIMNMTQRLDGQWRALSSRSKNDKINTDHGVREMLYKNQHYFGLHYTSELAKQVTALGYNIIVKDEYGNFEIEGLPQIYIDSASKRRQQILKRLDELSLSSAKAAEKANLDQRAQKELIDSNKLKGIWQEDAAQFGIDFDKLIEQSKTLKTGKTQIHQDLVVSLDAQGALDDAISHLSEFTTRIKHASLIKEAFKFAVGQVSHEELEKELGARLQAQEIFGIENYSYTSKTLLGREQQFIAQFTETKGKGVSLDTNGVSLGADILRSKDSVHLVDVWGIAAEKSLLEELVSTTENEGPRAFILHQGKFQAARINDTVQRDNGTWKKWFQNLFKPTIAQTVAGFKFKYEEDLKQGKAQHDVIIVHDAQKISYQDLSHLEQLSQKSQSKLVLLNNLQSRNGFHPGNPIVAMREAGITTHASSLSKPAHHVEIHPTQHGKEDVAAHFANLSKETRAQTPVIALSNKDFKELTQSIRGHLQDQGEISWHTREVQVLGSEHLSEAQRKYIKFYEPGYQISLNPFTENQETLQVIAKDNNALVVKDKSGNQKTIMPAMLQDALVIKTKLLEVGAGEQLCCQQDFMIGRVKINKGQQFTVIDIKAEGVTLSHNGKSSLYFSNEELTAIKLDYAYVKKPSQLTGDVSHALVALKSYQINQNTLGEIAEYAKTVHLYTEDKNKASEALTSAQVRHTVKEVIENPQTMIYRASDYAPEAIKASLEQLEDIFGKSGKEAPETTIAKALNFALAKLGERDAAISHQSLLREAVVAVMGHASVTDIEKALAEKKDKGELIHANTYWITPEALKIEQAILTNNKQEQNCIDPIAGIVSLPEHLTQGQKSAVSLILGTRDRFVSVQGLAGVGKTTMMQALQEQAEAADFKVVGLAPMHTSKEELIANKIDARTVAQFLVEDIKYDKKTIFIIDECSMIGNEDYLKIQEKIKFFNARGVFSGDITQLQSPTAGIPHELTIKTSSQKKAFMTEIMRQNPNPTLKDGVLHAVNKNIKGSFDQLKKINPEDHIHRDKPLAKQSQSSVVEINCFDKKNRKFNLAPIYKAVANDYLSRIPEHQKQTLVIAHAHEDRRVINDLIRKGLKEKGEIVGQDSACTRLKNRSFTKAELLDVSMFKPGQFIRFEKNYSIAEKGSYLRIGGIDKEKNLLHCQSEDNHCFSINPAKIAIKSGMTVYEKEAVNLAPGDRIRLKLTQKTINHIANKEYTVEEVIGQKALIKNEEGSLHLDLKNLKHSHWDYAYSTTAFGAQGQTSQFVIALELAKRRQASSYRAHIIDVTRPRAQVTVYTENQQALTERYMKFEGDKPSAWLTKELDKAKPSQNKSTDKQKQTHQAEPKQIKTTEPKPDYKANAQQINEVLSAQFENLTHHLLGEPNRNLSSANNLRYGSKGSLSINLSKGLWHNFETGEKGNALQLISMQLGFSDFKDTITYAKEYLNHHEFIHPITSAKPAKEALHKESSNKKSYAQKLVKQSQTIEGTLADAYLKNHRGINQYQGADLRFLPKVSTLHDNKKTQVPALLCIGRDDNNEVNHVQVIWLDPKSGGKDKLSNISKQTYGAINGIGIELNKKGLGDTTYLAEGVETGLALVETEKNARVFALLSKSNFSNVNLSQLQHHVVICLDNDGKKTFSDNLIFKAVERLELAGKTVSLIMPDKAGTDFNDLLKSHGASGVKKLMSRQISGSDLLHNSEKFKAFTGDNMDDVLKHLNSAQPKKIREISSVDALIKPVYRNNLAQKQLILER